ncbi:MAG: hypothetical protein NT069_09875 [Planctomycetota bacterium]|nr:hypothetical protein [Planctomycetota bacterium]
MTRFLFSTRFGPRLKAFTRCPNWYLFLRVILFFVFSQSLLPAAESLDDSTTRYLAGLRTRGLHRLAVSYCEHRLQPQKLGAGERADLTLELSRTLLEQARMLPSAERDGLWDRAGNIVDEVLKNQPANPRRLLLQTQRGLVRSEIGSFCRWRLSVAPWDAAVRDKGIAELTTACDEFRQLEGVLAKAKSTSGKKSDAGSIPAHQLRSLHYQVRRMLGQALTDLAEIHLADSPDRAAHLNEAQRMLKTLADSRDEDEVGWESRLLMIRATRLHGDSAQARKQIELVRKREPDAQTALRLTLEEIRCRIADANLDASRALLERLQAGTPESARLTGDLEGERDLLTAELLSAIWRRTEPRGSRTATHEFQVFEKYVLERTGQLGPEWSERLSALQDAVREERLLGPELAALSLRAQGAFFAGNLPEAERLYGVAASQAHAAGLADRAFTLGMQRSSIALKREDWTAAATDLNELATTYRDHARAGEAHLLAAYALGREWQRERSPATHDAYRNSLERHTRDFAADATGPEAEWMFAELLAYDHEFGTAFAHYQKIPPAHARFVAARTGAARACEQHLQSLGASENSREFERAAVAYLTASLSAPPDVLSRDQVETALALASILQRKSPPDFVGSDRLLTRVFESLEQVKDSDDELTPEQWSAEGKQRVRGMQLRVLSLAGQQRFSEARRVLEQVAKSSPLELLGILEGVGSLSADARQDPLNGLADLQLTAARTLDARRAELQPAELKRLDLALARALRANAHTLESVEVYSRLATAHPRDASVLAEQGDFLLSLSDADQQRAGLVALRKLESLHRPGTEAWLGARLRVARGLFQVGQREETRKLIRKTRLLYPKLGNPELSQSFGDLENECADAGK